MEKDLSGERVFINPPWELAEQSGRHFERRRRKADTFTRVALVFPG
jgi:hypothetical protein